MAASITGREREAGRYSPAGTAMPRGWQRLRERPLAHTCWPSGGKAKAVSGMLGAPLVRVDREQRMRRADEQPRPVDAAEGEVRYREWHFDRAQLGAVRRNAMHAVGGAAPDVSVLVEAKSVGEAGRDLVKDPSCSEPLAAVENIKDADMLHRVGHELTAALGDVEQTFVGREGKTVRPLEIVGHDLQAAILRIETVQHRRLLRRLLAAFVVGIDAVMRVAEPDRAVRPADHIIGRIQALAHIAVGQHGDAAVEFRASDAAMPVRTADQPTLPVAGMAVGEAGRSAEHRQPPIRGPAHDPVVGKVANQQAILVGEPDRPLQPGKSLAELYQRRIWQHTGPKARVEDLELVHLCEATGSAGGPNMQLDCHQHGRHVADRSRAMTVASVRRSAALIFAQRELAGALHDTRAVHRFNPPPAGQHDDPLRRRVLVPIADPAYGLHGADDCRLGPLLLIVPLRRGTADALKLELREGASGLVTDPLLVRPQVPIKNLRPRA